MQDDIRQIEEVLSNLRRIANDPETSPELRARLLEVLISASKDLIRAKSAQSASSV